MRSTSSLAIPQLLGCCCISIATAHAQGSYPGDDIRLVANLSFSADAAGDDTQSQTTAAPANGATSATAAAATGLDDFWTRDRMLGDWWGARTTLEDHGITAGLRLSQYFQQVASGGKDQNGEYGGTMDYRLKVDGGKLFNWDGLFVNMHARTRFGQDVNSHVSAFALQNAGLLMPAPGDYNDTDITGLMIGQEFKLFGKPAIVAGGMLDVIDTVSMFFPSVGFGQEGFWNVNGLVTALPWFGAVQGLSLYGGLVATIHPKYGLAETGFMATGTRGVSTEWGSISNSFEDGVWLAGFHRFFWELDEKMGYFMVFGGGSTKEQAANDPNDFVIVPGQGIESTDEKNPWDIALYFYQELWKAEDNPDRKATLLLGGTIGPDDPQFAEWHIFARVELYGPMESRPNDRMGVSGWYNGLSDNFKDLVSPVVDIRDTWGVELYYNIEVTPWLHLTPDLQIIRTELADDDTAVIIGLRGVIDF